jgi:ATP-dependent Clp protease ATP-binding subunit ClpB
MDMRKFTEKSALALSGASRIATEYGNQEVCALHLLYALLSDDEGLIPNLLEKCGVDGMGLRAAAEREIARLPKSSGDNRFYSRALQTVLEKSESRAKSLRDEYVSVEHLFMELIDSSDKAVKTLLEAYRVEMNAFMRALATVRGGQRVTGDNPEDTYNVLKKYGTDLVERARERKLDPVIGRDEEIRNVIRIL